MRFWLRFFLPLLILAGTRLSVFAEIAIPDIQDPQGVQTVGISKGAEAVRQGAADCGKSYSQNKCGELKSSLPAADQKNIIDCSIPENYIPARIAIGIGQGVGAFVWDSAKGVVALPYNVGRGLMKAPAAIADGG